MDEPNPLTGAFSQMEQSIGVEAYQANIEHQQAHTRREDAETDQVKMKTNLLSSLSLFIMALGTLAFIPVLVWLWNWAV